MPRITVKTAWPLGMTQSDALSRARLAAVDQIPFQCVEQHTEPQSAMVPDPKKPGAMIPSPNDETVDRFLVTSWDFTK